MHIFVSDMQNFIAACFLMTNGDRTQTKHRDKNTGLVTNKNLINYQNTVWIMAYGSTGFINKLICRFIKSIWNLYNVYICFSLRPRSSESHDLADLCLKSYLFSNDPASDPASKREIALISIARLFGSVYIHKVSTKSILSFKHSGRRYFETFRLSAESVYINGFTRVRSVCL